MKTYKLLSDQLVLVIKSREFGDRLFLDGKWWIRGQLAAMFTSITLKVISILNRLLSVHLKFFPILIQILLEQETLKLREYTLDSISGSPPSSFLFPDISMCLNHI